MKTVNGFQGDYRFLSNFWPCYVEYDNIVYPTVEHAYQSAKVKDVAAKNRIKDCPTPSAAKDFFETYNIKPDEGWTVTKKLAVMEELLTVKFGGRSPFLTRALLDTGNAMLVEENNWNDTFWGVCNDAGENNLGKIMMNIRQELIRQKEDLLKQLSIFPNNEAVANSLSITQRELYEKMIAFQIKNEEYWIS